MTVSDRYLALLKGALTYTLWPEPFRPIEHLNDDRPLLKRALVALAANTLRRAGYQLSKDVKATWDDRRDGRIWPHHADTMIGLTRLNHLQHAVETVLREGIPGDFIETGVWRGGACILIRGVLAAHGITDRRVFVADSFAGFPSIETPQDEGDRPEAFRSYIAVSEAQVRDNFRRYGLLDDQVVFLSGWFKDTLPNAPIAALSVLRLAGDMYGSTMDGFNALYHKLSPGGFCIVDDYGALESCRQAVTDYRAAHGITAEIHPIDWTGVYWRKSL